MNDAFSQLATQLQALWKELGLNQRVSLVLAAGVVLLGLGGLAFWSSRTDYALLYGRLEDAEAAKVIAALDDAKIPYKAGRGTVSVPADKVHVMRMQLAAKGIPRAGDGVGFEIFDKPNFGISDFVQRANYLRAVQGELSRTVAQVDAVESARVMIVIPENRLLTDNNRKPTASVFVRVRGNATLPPQTVNAIRFLIANAVEGLQANFVTVVDNQGNVLSENNENDPLAGLSATQLNARKNLEQYFSKKAEGMLDKVLGAGRAVVRVSAEINFDTLTRTEEKYDPESAILRTSTLNDENTDSLSGSGTNSGGANSGGTPGTASNSSLETNNVALAPATKSNTKKKVANNFYEINKVVNNLMQTAGGVKRLSAAVFVAARMNGSGTNRVAAPRTDAELTKLKSIVRSSLGIQEGADALRKDEITLEEILFNDELGQDISLRLDQQQKSDFWWNLANAAVYPALALAVLLFFWRTFKRTPDDAILMGIPLSQLTSANNGNGEANGGGNAYARASGTPPTVTVDVLNQLIRENPNNMSEAIRSWMTRSKPAK